MIRFFLQRLIKKNRDMILREAVMISGFMVLLMRPINTGERWTKEQRQELKGHFRHLSAYIPVLILFLLPGGSLLLPVFAEILDRRSERRQL